MYNTTDVVWAAIVTWKFPDGIIRINNKPEQPYLNLIQHSPYDQVKTSHFIAETLIKDILCRFMRYIIFQPYSA